MTSHEMYGVACRGANRQNDAIQELCGNHNDSHDADYHGFAQIQGRDHHLRHCKTLALISTHLKKWEHLLQH